MKFSTLPALPLPLLAIPLLWQPLQADAQQGVIEEVVVTAQKREQTLSEVPISLAVLDGEFLGNAGVDDFSKAASFIPNLNFQQGFDRSEVAVSIRGLTSGTSNPGIDPSVGFFLDGVYIARPAALTGKFLGVERLEVLRGPQGTLYGRNTSAGAVNIYTKDPGNEFEAEVKAGYGNFGEYSFGGTVSGPFGGQTGGVLLSGFYSEGDTYLDNVATGDPLGKREDYGLFAKLLLDPTDRLGLALSLDYSESATSAAGIVGAFQKHPQDLFAVFGAARMNPALAGFVRGVQDVPVDSFGREVGRSDEPQADDLEQFGLALTIEYDLPFGTLTSITSYRDSEDYAAVDPDLSPMDIFLTSVRNEDQQVSQELRVASSGASRFNYLLGLYYFDSEFTVETQTEFGVPLFRGFVSTPQRANSIASQEAEAFALFGQLTFDLSDALTLTYGFRFNDEKKASVIDQNPDPGIRRGSGIPFPLQFLVLPGHENDVSDDDFISTLNLNWELGQASNIYLSYAEGLKSGGVNANIVLNTDSLTFEKETSTNYELGFRSTLAPGTRVSAALFFTEFDDLQIATFDPTNPSNIIVANAGAAEIFGVEADMVWMVNEHLEFNAAIAYNDSEYKDTRLPGTRLGGHPALPGLSLNLPDPMKDVSGQALGRAPKWSLSIGGQVDFGLSDDVRGMLRADYSHSSSQFLDPILSPQSEIDGYGVVNVRANLFSENDGWRVTLFANNLFDEDYYTQLIASPGAAALLVNPMVATWIGAQGLPRTYGVELSWRLTR